MRLLTICFFLTIFLSNSNAQIDWGSWASFQLNYKAGDKVTLKAKPIWRQKSDFSALDNTSIDFIVAYKINSRWSVNSLNRHFFIPDNGDRQFWFFDVNYKHPLVDKLSWSHKMRYHLAVNWNRNDTDFMRYISQLNYKLSPKITSIIAADFFYRLTEKRTLSGVRYKLGLTASLNPKTKLTLQYWRQVLTNEDYPIGQSNFLILNLAYNLN